MLERFFVGFWEEIFGLHGPVDVLADRRVCAIGSDDDVRFFDIAVRAPNLNSCVAIHDFEDVLAP
jgi:hypothetical protein